MCLCKVEMSLLAIMYSIWLDLGRVVKCRKMWNPIIRMFFEIVFDHFTQKIAN